MSAGGLAKNAVGRIVRHNQCHEYECIPQVKYKDQIQLVIGKYLYPVALSTDDEKKRH